MDPKKSSTITNVDLNSAFKAGFSEGFSQRLEDMRYDVRVTLYGTALYEGTRDTFEDTLDLLNTWLHNGAGIDVEVHVRHKDAPPAGGEIVDAEVVEETKEVQA